MRGQLERCTESDTLLLVKLAGVLSSRAWITTPLQWPVLCTQYP